MLCAIPIEILTRDLDGSLFLALHLAARGLPTLLGERMVSRIVRRAGNPVFFFDGDQDADMNDAVLRAGGFVANMNPEGLGPLNGLATVDNFLKVAPHTSAICAWGDFMADIFRERLAPEDQAKVMTTGYPSFDLLSPEFIPYYQDQAITAAHGEDFILINTNFECNHTMGLDNYIKMVARMPEWGLYADENFLRVVRRRVEYQKGVLERFIGLARDLAGRFPGRHVIIRPHPIENAGYYAKRLAGLKNVFVTKEKPVRAWIASASLVIHHDCTTGLEASLMGKLVARYQPMLNTDLVHRVLWEIGIQATRPEEVVALLEEGPTAGEQLRLKALLAPYLANLDGSASRKLADLAAEVSTANGSTWVPDDLSFLDQIKCWRKHLSKILRSYQPGRNGRKVRYALSKFPALPYREVEDRLDRLRRLRPDLPAVTLKKLTLNTFLIQPKD